MGAGFGYGYDPNQYRQSFPTSGQEESREIRKGVFSKLTVVFIFVFSIVFIAAVLVVFYATGAEPVALIGFVGAVVVAELLALTTIKKTKLGKNDDLEKRVEHLERLVREFLTKKEGDYNGTAWETVGGTEKAAGAAADAGTGWSAEANPAPERDEGGVRL